MPRKTAKETVNTPEFMPEDDAMYDSETQDEYDEILEQENSKKLGKGYYDVYRIVGSGLTAKQVQEVTGSRESAERMCKSNNLVKERFVIRETDLRPLTKFESKFGRKNFQQWLEINRRYASDEEMLVAHDMTPAESDRAEITKMQQFKKEFDAKEDAVRKASRGGKC